VRAVSDIPIFEVKKCLENLEIPISACVSESLKHISRSLKSEKTGISENSQTESDKEKGNEKNKIENISKPELPEDQSKGVESISDPQDLKDYHYFKSEDYFSDRFFNDFGIQNIEHKEYGYMHYYKIPYSEISKDKYNDFSSRFASKSNLYVIDEKEYNSIKVEEEEKEK